MPTNNYPCSQLYTHFFTLAAQVSPLDRNTPSRLDSLLKGICQQTQNWSTFCSHTNEPGLYFPLGRDSKMSVCFDLLTLTGVITVACISAVIVALVSRKAVKDKTAEEHREHSSM